MHTLIAAPRFVPSLRAATARPAPVTRPQLAARVLRVALVVALVVGAALAAAAPAQGAATPAFRVGTVACLNGGLLRAFPPPMMRPVFPVDHRRAEMVRWSPDLQVLTQRGWRDYDTSRPFYTAFTSSYGYSNTMYGQGWYGGIGQLQFVPFYNLPAGTYRVRNWLYWRALGRTYYADGGSCRFV